MAFAVPKAARPTFYNRMASFPHISSRTAPEALAAVAVIAVLVGISPVAALLPVALLVTGGTLRQTSPHNRSSLGTALIVASLIFCGLTTLAHYGQRSHVSGRLVRLHH